MSARADEPLASRREPLWPHALALAATFAALFAWNWGAWPDVLVDFGRELYVPWQITQGKRLFGDLAWFNGPLSPSWNALMFRVFGVGLATLVWVNAALLALLITLLHYVLRSISSPRAATGACFVVLAVCGFGQLAGIGNYNFICPYSHEATHGLLLGIAALAALQRGRGASVWTFVAGLCVGLAFLTKPEMFVAAFAGAGTALALHVWSSRLSWAKACSAFALGAVVPIGAAFALLSVSLPCSVAWRGVLGAWPSLFASDVAASPFYRVGMGLDAPGANALAMFTSAGALVLMLAPSLALALRMRHKIVASLLAFAITGVTFGVLLVVAHVPMLEAARAWPLFAALAAIVGFVRVLRESRNVANVGGAAFAVFALCALAKIVLNARVAHYGFALALPATALVAIVLLDGLPHYAETRAWNGAPLRAGAVALLLGFAFVPTAFTRMFHERKNEIVGSGVDGFRADARGRVVNEALRWIEQRYPTNAPRPTLAVLPEGVTINYLARLENPTPYVNFMPPEMLFFGESTIVAAFRAHPPDLVMIAHKDTSEYGAPFFGADYARDLSTWLHQNYDVARTFGGPPLKPGSVFGIAVLVRKNVR
jgi:hypothetical protein